MRKFNAVYKDKQAKSEKILEEKLLNEFKEVYSNLLEQYRITEFYDLDEESQVAFLRELNEYWTEELGISEAGKSFLETKSLLLTESSTEIQKKSYLHNKATAIISETLRQADIKTKLYGIIDEMYKSTKSNNLDELLSSDAIARTILESFGASLQDLMTEIVYEISGEELNEREFSENRRKKLAKNGEAMKDGSFPIVNKEDLKNAIKAHGRAKDPEAAKAHIKARARALKATNLLPDDWK